ncbi:PTS sugar transporter subunit IIA [Buttiauxella warmboldiae]|uniref:PTS sugar transporter subunit IIA n=1 Tax=Buttiauxella warmboldiae TaxID=82993 RepID=A0A3N5DKB9_9ENTR|nr:PTS sugar transporter subunit IIA [Buttiauxella warmboldiae]RPH29088.1 PTS sugar transporter subunit IIA [Buttiauxella warmboldiae]
MSIAASFDTQFILLKHPKIGRLELFDEINTLLINENIVQPTYLNALIAREDEHPTAMQLEKIGVAIPHVDIEHVQKEKVVVVTSPEGIEFNQAEDPELTMKVHVIFFLLLKEKDAHLEFLMKLIGLFRQTDKMDLIMASGSAEEVKAILTATLK